MLNITQNDYNIIKQRINERYIKLNILDFQYQTVDEISGNMISCSVQCDADSDLRRSCSVSLVVRDNSFDIQSGGKIWLDKYIQVYIGLKNIYTQEIQWYNQGIYLIDAPSWKYDATTNTLSFSGLDLMSKLTVVRNGQLQGIPTVIKQGESVREAMIATLSLGGFTKYVISECINRDGSIQEVPYDIEIDQGGYVYDILSSLCDILPQYQIYFDVDGVFHYDLIPSGDNEPVVITDDIWKNILIGEDISTDFASVKNYVEVYGYTHDPEYYPSEISVSGATITMTITKLTALSENIVIGFTPSSAVSGNIQLAVNEFGAKNLVDSNGNYITSLDANVYYVAMYQANGTWKFLGHQQAQATWSDTNPDSPFYVNGSVGIIRQVLCGGDYENIQSDELALERAKIEIYWKCRLNDSITLNVVPIPWIDVNLVVSHAPKDEVEEKRYIVKSYSVDYGSVESTMNVSMVSYYEYYPMY